MRPCSIWRRRAQAGLDPLGPNAAITFDAAIAEGGAGHSPIVASVGTTDTGDSAANPAVVLPLATLALPTTLAARFGCDGAGSRAAKGLACV